MQVRSKRLVMTSLSTGVAVTGVLSAGWTTAAHAGSGFVGGINDARSSHGLPAYTVAADLQSMASAQAARMAARLTIFHNPDLAAQGGSWRSLGENVGVGADQGSLAAAFLASPEHRANILSSTFSQVVVGTATGSDGRLYVDEVFRLPSGTAAPAASASPTTSAPSPAPTRSPASPPAATPTAQLRGAASGSPASGSTGSRVNGTGSRVGGSRVGGPTGAPASSGASGAGSDATENWPELAGAADSTATSRAWAGSARANRSEQRTALSSPVLGLTAAQQRQLADAAAGSPSSSGGDDPIARSLRWWRGMRTLTG